MPDVLMNSPSFDRSFVIISDVDWHGHWVCEQQLTHLLSRDRRVLYVEQSRTLLAFLHRKGGDKSPWEKVRMLVKGLRQETGNLFIISPPLLLPFRYLPFIHNINTRVRLWWLRKVLKKMGIHEPVVITFEPDSGGLIGKLNEIFSIYYRNDNHDRRGLWFNPDSLVRRREAELMRRVDVVAALSDGLARKSRELHVKTFVLPNGVDFDLFQNRGNGDEPRDIRLTPRPRIGVVGMLDWRIDFSLLEELARKRPDWSIVLIGPLSPPDSEAVKLLGVRANVHFLGQKAVRCVPAYLRALDIGLIPYRLNEYTRSILSLKLFEYAAIGLPAVATPMPELQRYSEFVCLANNSIEFESCIEKLLDSFSTKEERNLHEFAAQNSWNARVEQLLQIISTELGRPDAMILRTPSEDGAVLRNIGPRDRD